MSQGADGQSIVMSGGNGGDANAQGSRGGDGGAMNISGSSVGNSIQNITVAEMLTVLKEELESKLPESQEKASLLKNLGSILNSPIAASVIGATLSHVLSKIN